MKIFFIILTCVIVYILFGLFLWCLLRIADEEKDERRKDKK